MRTKYLIPAATTIALFVFGGCADETVTRSVSKELLGTTVTITVHNAGPRADAAIREAFAAIEGVGKSMNRFDEASELAKLNALAGKGAVSVSDDLFDVIKSCDWYSGKTYGAFDATILPIMLLWNFKGEDPGIPSGEQVSAALSLVGYNKVELNRKDNLVVLAEKGMGLDLGGIAKGYAVDKAVRALRERGVVSAMVMGAGNIGFVGLPPGRPHWRIAVKHPRNAEADIGILQITSGAVATSGDYERFVMIDGKRYSHMIDPLTGWPVSNGVVSVTVIAPTAQEADAFSTAIFVMGAEKGMKYTEFHPSIETIIITEDNAAKLTIHTSAGLANIFEAKDPE